MDAEPFSGSLAARIDHARASRLSLYWLGQAGFLVVAGGRRILIDPYLSDSLAEKYRGKPYSHERMMPAPITAGELGPVDLVLVTHQHTDHMDAATLAPIAAANPDCRFIVPRASLEEATRRIGIGGERIVAVDAGETVSPFANCSVTAVRAAHETLERSPEGDHRFLGFVLRIAGANIYHSGDTIPFDGLAEEVAALAPDIALLPVNGRTPELAAGGVAGNLTISEAIALAEAIGADDMIAHHYGMFAFNTVPPEAIDRAIALHDGGLRIHRAQLGLDYSVRKD